MFQTLQGLPPDPILGLISLYRQDTNPRKVDLGVGVYKDEAGLTPVLPSVRQAEQAMLARQESKSYVGPFGNMQFNSLLLELVLGEGASRNPRLAAIQTPGGCGALRVGAELIKAANPKASIWVSDPTWGNHKPLLGNAGLQLRTYPYFDAERQSLNFDAMTAALEQVPAGDLVLLHACCHNPTGVDLTASQWQRVAEIAAQRGFTPFVDMAYQGFGEGLDEDALGLRLLINSVPEVLFAVSCSKNFGLYRERVGLVGLLTETAEQAKTALSHFAAIARGIYSMPPDHGAAVVAGLLADPALRKSWVEEVDQMRGRINGLRRAFAERMRSRLGHDRFAFVAEQRGMFSFLGLSEAQVDQLAKAFGIYMLSSSRTSIAGLSETNLDYVCDAIASVLEMGNTRDRQSER